MKVLSIIIVAYKGWARLNKCLEALDSFAGSTFKSEVIVVDNKSEDETIYKLVKRFSKFRFIHNNINGGFANGCNLGSKSATGDFLLFLNPDTVASESELEKLLNVARKNPSFGIVSCRQVNERSKVSIASGPFPGMFNLTGLQRAIFKGRQARGDRRQEEINFPDWVSGSVIMIRKEIFENIGGFDEDFWMYYEDVDLCRRVRNIPLEIGFCNNITIEHNHGGSSRINLKTASMTKTEVHISQHVYISKHKTGLNKYLIQTFLIINNLITCGIMALSGLIFFFIPKVFLRAMIFLRLIRYYVLSLTRFSWISQKSVNYNR